MKGKTGGMSFTKKKIIRRFGDSIFVDKKNLRAGPGKS